MYSLIKGHSASNFLITQLPSLVAAFLIAELFYKFRSFALECLGFLVTWFVLDWAWTKILQAIRPGFGGPQQS